MIKITVGEEIRAVCPQFAVAIIQCDVTNTPYNAELWYEIEQFSNEFRKNVKISEINKLPNIVETREVYKKLGKEPNRYRPAGEALLRRIAKGVDLYRIDTLVDLINLLSMKFGYSIGGFDADSIQGNLRLGVGRNEEPFEAIGRGQLNIENMPVYRDSVGGVGTPSSDEERTKITSSTSRLLILINGYSGEKGLPDAVEYVRYLLEKYADAKSISVEIKSPPKVK